MIKLNDELIVGQGSHRTCYRHPKKHNLCVKVNHRNNQKDQVREVSYYQHLTKRGISWDYLTRYYGTISTNIGLGYIFDLVVDSNLQPSKTLEYYLERQIPEGTIKSLLRLKAYLLQFAIVTTELKPRNIVCIKKDKLIESCVIVDDIGNTEFIPVSSYFLFLARSKINRKWHRFESSLNERGLFLANK